MVESLVSVCEFLGSIPSSTIKKKEWREGGDHKMGRKGRARKRRREGEGEGRGGKDYLGKVQRKWRFHATHYDSQSS